MNDQQQTITAEELKSQEIVGSFIQQVARLTEELAVERTNRRIEAQGYEQRIQTLESQLEQRAQAAAPQAPQVPAPMPPAPTPSADTSNA